MNIIYLITILLLYIIVLFSKKTNKKQNFVIFSIFLLGIMYFANILLISILSLIKLNVNFTILSIINCIFIGITFFTNYKQNKQKIQMQKFDYNKKEILCVFLIAIVCGLIGIVRFNKFNNISYETTDPAVHYKVAVAFSENMSLLTKTNSASEMYKDFNHAMPGFSLNCGILMKALSFIPRYTTYMIFETIALCLIALTFYITCLKIKKTRDSNIVIFALSCLYLGSYALNNMIFGFGYLGIGILATNLIILTWLYIEENKNCKNIYYVLLFLFNYSLFFSYYLFVPTIYLAQGLYLIYKWIKKKETFKRIVKVGVSTLIIPFLIGIIYFVLPGFFSETSNNTMTSAIALEGYIYRDLWSNFILIAPLIIISIYKELKEKRISFMTILFIIEFIYIVVTFILGLKGYISSYYYFKSYYIFWLFCYIYIVKLINSNNPNNIKLFKFSIAYICFIIVICLSNVEQKIQEKNILFNNVIVSPSYANIYWFNASKTIEKNPVLNSGELQLVNKTMDFKDKCLYNKEIPFVGSYLQKLWIYSISDIVPIYNHSYGNLSGFYENNFDYNLWNGDNNSKCLVIFNRENKKDSENYIYINYDNYDILYKNNDGYIIRKPGI